MKVIISLLLIFSFLFFKPSSAEAQEINQVTSPTPTAPVKEDPKQLKKLLANPESDQEKKEAITLITQRAKGDIGVINFLPYAMLHAIQTGVSANTITLILLLPLLATIIVIFRYIIGLSGLGLMVPLALSVTLLATGVTPGFIILAAILLSSFFSRFILKKIRIMQMPKLALSMWLAAVVVLITLTLSMAYGVFDVRNVSIFPILLFLLLGDRIFALFMEGNLRETIQTTAITLLLGLLGFAILSWIPLRSFVLLYPEFILLLIPLNIMIGRYFGLRMTEYIKFQPVIKHGNK
jgi:hypothetical protein